MSTTFYLTQAGKETLALEELGRHRIHDCEQVAPGVIRAPHEGAGGTAPCFAFIRQTLTCGGALQAESISQWSKAIVDAVESALASDSHPWRLHLVILSEEYLHRRAELIRAAVLEHLGQKRRGLLKRLIDQDSPIQATTEYIVQIGLLSKSEGVVSTQLLSAGQNEHLVSCFEGGRVPVPEDKFPPSRAYKKLLEAELRAGRRIRAGESCVDLGASPGGWTAVALQRGARVTAVDRSPLRDDLMSNPNLQFVKGDGFSFKPAHSVDWLLCDIIAYPERSLELIDTWLSNSYCKQLIVTLKFQGVADFAAIERATASLSQNARNYFVKALDNNKNEVTVWGAI